MTIDLPLIQPVLPSKSDILATCGELIYTFVNPDQHVFTQVRSASSDNTISIQIEVQTDNEWKASFLLEDEYRASYQLNVEAYFQDHQEVKTYRYWESDEPDRKAEMTLKVRDNCLGLEYNSIVLEIAADSEWSQIE